MLRKVFVFLISFILVFTFSGCEFSAIDNSSVDLPITTTELLVSTTIPETTTSTSTTTNQTTPITTETVTTTTPSTTTTTSTSTATTSLTTTTEAITTTLSSPTESILTMISTTATTTTTAKPKVDGIQPLPEFLQNVVDSYKKMFPGMHIGVGLFSIDGTKGYAYNMDEEISGGCTVKAAYSLFVLNECQNNNIDIYSYKLEYKYGMRNSGSGQIKYSSYGTWYTIDYLLKQLLGPSDNTAYNILVSKFPLKDFQVFLNSINGQNLNGFQYGDASVRQRLNEWVEVLKYIDRKETYSTNLYNYLHNNTINYYIVKGMANKPANYLNKTGTSDGTFYNSASDVAVINGEYIAIVMTEDYVSGESRQEVARGWGTYTEKYINMIGGTQNLF